MILVVFKKILMGLKIETIGMGIPSGPQFFEIERGL